MAETLERIARSGGSDIFYHGELAEQIADDFKANGGLIDRQDLARYELSKVKPVWGDYRDNRIATSPPPGSGFPMLELLHIMVCRSISDSLPAKCLIVAAIPWLCTPLI